jgi:multidrug efflux pump subunit AcrA (membrane-fusion protein)
VNIHVIALEGFDERFDHADVRPFIARIIIPWVFSLLLASWLVGDTTEGRRPRPRLLASHRYSLRSADQRPSKPADPVAAPEKAQEKSPRPGIRRTLFALLPFALIGGGYWYVTGGRVMSTDDAYVEANKVGLSTEVSGIVKTIAVVENQKVSAGEILFRLDDLPFQNDRNLPPLRAGMSVEVNVDTGHARGLPHFLAALFGHSPRQP